MGRIAKALIAAAAVFAACTVEAQASQADSVVGQAEIDQVNPVSVFEFSVHARADQGVIWMAHRNDTQIGWMVARVECVRVSGRVGVVTGVVVAAQDFVVGPGDPVGLTVRDDGTRDQLGFPSPEQIKRCQPGQLTHEISRGDFKIFRR